MALVVAAGTAAWGSWRFSSPYSRIGGIRNVVLISIDTCRADHLSCYGYPRKTTPNIDAVARDGVLFNFAITPVPMTLPAHCSMLIGTYPEIHGVRLNTGYRVDDANVTLAEIMRAAGYQTAAFVGGFPLDSRFGLNQGFETYDGHFSGGGEVGPQNERKAEEVNRPAMAWLDEHGGKPFFLFLHYFDPHYPYVPPPPFASTYADDLYAGEIAYVDSCIGQVLDKLRALGLYDNTLVIVTGDHGEGLNEHGERQHGFLIYQSTMHVPLIVRVPKGDVRGGRVDEGVSLVDIVPTVLGLIGLSTPQQVQGVDLSGYLEGTPGPEKQRPIHGESVWPELFGCSPLYGIFDGVWKYIKAPKPELYDLSRDGGEKANVVGKEPQIAHRLRVRLEESLKAMESVANRQSSAVPFDKDTMRQLESLGYVVGGVVRGDSGSADLGREDPKDFLAIFERFQTANSLFAAQRYQEAKKKCLDIISVRPRLLLPHILLGQVALGERRAADAIRHLSTALSILSRSKDVPTRLLLEAEAYNTMQCHANLGCALMMERKLDQAVVEFEIALRIDPEFFQAHNGLGLALQEQGKIDQAITHYQKALEINPDSADAHYNLARALAGRGQVDEAIAHFRKALEIQPDLVMAHNDLGVALAGRGQVDEAIAHFRKALEIQPDLAMTHNNLGAALAGRDEFAEAVVHYRKALAIKPRYVSAQNNLAWMLASCPEASIRNGAQAVELARQLVRLSGGRNPAFLNALAAAYAETQQFPKAVATAKKAIALARSAKQTILAERIQSRLDLYRAGRPYRKVPSEASSAPAGP